MNTQRRTRWKNDLGFAGSVMVVILSGYRETASGQIIGPKASAPPR